MSFLLGVLVLMVPSMALAEAVIRIAADQLLREQLSQGAEALGRQFDWGEIAAETIRVYQSF